jgi:predicted metalloprotease with PDZ domain
MKNGDNNMPKTNLRNPGKQNLLVLLLLSQLCAVSALGQNLLSIRMNVDATDAARNLLRTTLTIPVKPGPLTLFYPKWIPGEHSPTGPINDVVGLQVSAGGKSIPWQRDEVEMFAFHCQIPAGVNTIEVRFDDVSQPGTTMTARLARIKWNRLILYPQGIKSDNIQVVASMRTPAGWKFATALPVMRETRGEIQFKEVSLTELVDSPVIIGANFRKVSLSSGPVLHEMDIVADTPAALETKPQIVTGWQNLVKEANALFGALH